MFTKNFVYKLPSEYLVFFQVDLHGVIGGLRFEILSRLTSPESLPSSLPHLLSSAPWSTGLYRGRRTVIPEGCCRVSLLGVCAAFWLLSRVCCLWRPFASLPRCCFSQPSGGAPFLSPCFRSSPCWTPESPQLPVPQPMEGVENSASPRGIRMLVVSETVSSIFFCVV